MANRGEEMKSVLISIQPKYCELIANGEKTIEVRKTRPKIKTPFKCYIYCTKEKLINNVFLIYGGGKYACFGDYRNACTSDADGKVDCYIGNGKIIGEFVCDWVTKITPSCDIKGCVNQYIHGYPAILDENDCLSFQEMKAYLGNKKGYDWHISDLVIYDKPKKLSEFKTCNKCKFSKLNGNCFDCDGYDITRPPQSWCYVEELKEKQK